VVGRRCPDPSFPTRSAGWRQHAGGAAAASLAVAERHDVVACAGLLAKAAIEAAQAALAERGE
jgi:hypothetical protein